MNRKLVQRFGATLFAGALALGVAACGDDDAEQELEQDADQLEEQADDVESDLEEGADQLEEQADDVESDLEQQADELEEDVRDAG